MKERVTFGSGSKSPEACHLHLLGFEQTLYTASACEKTEGKGGTLPKEEEQGQTFRTTDSSHKETIYPLIKPLYHGPSAFHGAQVPSTWRDILKPASHLCPPSLTLPVMRIYLSP